MMMSEKRTLDALCRRLLDCGVISEWFFNGSYHVRVDFSLYVVSLVGTSVHFDYVGKRG